MTRHCWAVAEHNFVLLLQLCQEGNGELIIFCSSQDCERVFRQLRSMSPYESTMVNFSLAEFVERIKRISIERSFSENLSKNGFNIPQFVDVKGTSVSNLFNEALSSNDCLEAMSEAESEAIIDCSALGFNTTEECSLKKYFKKPDINSRQQQDQEHQDENLVNEAEDDDDSVDVEDRSGSEIHDSEEEVNLTCDIMNNVFKFKNLCLLQEESNGPCFKICGEDGLFINEINKSKVLWTMQDERERVSTDRLLRFQTRKKRNTGNYEVTVVQAGQYISTFNGLERGQLIVMKLDASSFLLGFVIKFRYKGKKRKIERRYTHDTLVFDLNNNTETQLMPCFKFSSTQNCLKEMYFSKFIEVSKYVCHLSKDSVDFPNLRFINNLILSHIRRLS